MVLLKELVEEAKKKYSYEPKQNNEEKRKQNQRKNKKHKSTGFYHVHKYKCELCTQGYRWDYYYDGFIVSRVDFFELKKVVLENGYPWGIENRNDAFKTSKLIGLPLYDLINK